MLPRTLSQIALLVILALPLAARAEQGWPVPAEAAGAFLSLLDASEVAAAWQQLSPLAQAMRQQDPWQNKHRVLRAAYGPVVQRTLRGVTLQDRYPALPDGRYAIVQFDTTFAAKRDSIETLVLSLTADDCWLIESLVIN